MHSDPHPDGPPADQADHRPDAQPAAQPEVQATAEITTSGQASAATPPAEGASGGVGQISEDRVREELKKVIDPELFVNIVDLGLIYEVDLSETDGGQTDVSIKMTMTSPMCPAGPQMIANSKQVLGQLPDIGQVEIKIVLDPPWTPDKMTDDARDQLGIF